MSLSKLKLDPSLNGDIISNMPPNIMETILSRLPIKEAVRTCILSKKWRYNWITLPELIFDFTLRKAMINRNDDNVEKFIDDVLSLHRGPICKFELSGNLCIQNTGYIDKWILCLSRNDIQEFILCLQPLLRDYELPSCLYSCELVTHLHLSYCTLKRPPLFSSFNFLKSLLLYKVEFVGFTYENLVSRCPVLERLKIEGLASYTDFIIYAPKLKSLVVNGFFEVTQNICLKNTPLLECVSLNLHCCGLNSKRLNRREGENSLLIKVFGCLDGVEKLSVRGNFLKLFVVDFVPTKLPNTYYRMKSLELQICFNDVLMVSMALCLIRSAPNLEELKIDAIIHTRIQPQFPEIGDGPEFSLNQLRNVKINSFGGWRRQLEFVEFLLSITPVLEKMSIYGHKDPTIAEGYDPMHGAMMLEVLMRFPRVSPEAKIEYFEAGKLVEFGK
ncbi:hypothetical protein NE237_021033 [Protea cynaroides]|uniref:FBD domain-containing protein n=1 Tax=Protea cynaroides TaxID=273540 RepID=A0A9Q0H7S0_9MAGN|nr:hypothetical protein NE237_021033 [Protea cynaroides]